MSLPHTVPLTWTNTKTPIPAIHSTVRVNIPLYFPGQEPTERGQSALVVGYQGMLYSDSPSSEGSAYFIGIRVSVPGVGETTLTPNEISPL